MIRPPSAQKCPKCGNQSLRFNRDAWPPRWECPCGYHDR